MNIKINLKEDFINLLKLEMDSLGIKYHKSKPIDYQYLNYLRKQKVPPVTKVYNTPQLFAFYKYKDKIEEIIRALENNIDLSSKLSTLSINSKIQDKMLNFFNIYHFHLGDIPHKTRPSFVERTEDLLFVYFHKKKAYILGVFPHPKEWLADNWAKIIYNNWPDLFSTFELKGFSNDNKHSNKDTIKLRKSGINTTINMNGKSYIPLNFGVTTSGIKIEDVIFMDKFYQRIGYLESILKNNLELHLKERLSKDIFMDFFTSNDNIEIKFKSFENYDILISIKNTKICLNMTYINILK